MSIALQNRVEELERRMKLIEDAYAVILANMAKTELQERQYDPSYSQKTLKLPEKHKLG